MAYSHLGGLVHKQAQKYGKKTAILYQDPAGEWLHLSWNELSDKIMNAAQALAEMALKPGDKVGIYSQNMEKYLVADFAVFAAKWLECQRIPLDSCDWLE